MKKSVAAFLGSAFVAVSQSSADIYHWIGGDGRWSDESKWSNYTQGNLAGKGIPDGTEDSVRFWSGGESRIEVDGDYAVGTVEVMQGTAGEPDTVFLTGDGSLSVGTTNNTNQSSLQVYANRKLVLDGADITAWGVQYVFESAELAVKTGSVYRPSYQYLNRAGARLTVDGGEVLQLPGGGGTVQLKDNWKNSAEGENIAFFDMRGGVFKTSFVVDNGVFRMSGGLFSPVNQTAVFSKYADVKVNGGELVLNPTADKPVENSGVFPDSAVLTLGSLARLNPTSSGEVDLPLNGGTVRGGAKFIADKDFSITGGGDLTFGGGMTLSPNADDPIDRALLDVDSLTLGGNLARPYNADTGIGISAGTNLYMCFPRPVTLAATNAGWFVVGMRTVMDFKSGVTIDTCDRADGTTPRDIMLRRPTFAAGSWLHVTGNGMATIAPWSDLGGMLSNVSVLDSSTLKMELEYEHCLRAEKLVMGSGAAVSVTPYPHSRFEAEDIEAADGAGFVFSGPVREAVLYPGFTSGPSAVDRFASGACPTVGFTGESLSNTWTGRVINGSVVIYRKNTVPATADFTGNRWTGAKDGAFADAANWSAATVPSTAGETAPFDGIANNRVEIPADGVSLYSLRFLSAAGPFVLDGGPIGIESRVYDDLTTCGVYSSSAFPVVIRNDIYRPDKSGNHAMICFSNVGSSYLALEGDVDSYARFDLRGDVRVLGNVTAMNLRFMTAPASAMRKTKLTVYGGASVSATSQSLTSSGPQGGMEIKSDGSLTVKGSVYGYTAYGTNHATRVDGLMDVQAPLGGSIGHRYVGGGRVKFKDTGSKATADYTVRIGENVRFSAETFVKPLEVEGTPTICSVKDWTYSAGPLMLPENCVLTVDTQDADTAAGYDCTFASAVSGPGALKVKGAGSLTLAAECSIGGGVVLENGTLSISGPQTFGSLAGTGTLIVDASGGTVPALDIDGAADFSDVGLVLLGVGETVGSGWVTIASVSAGSEVAGVPLPPSERWKTRVTVSADGTSLLQIKRRTGVEIIVR